jgi:hypothetical protein
MSVSFHSFRLAKVEKTVVVLIDSSDSVVATLKTCRPVARFRQWVSTARGERRMRCAGTDTISADEEEQTLLELYRETALVRAHAAVLLKQRGYDVSDPHQFTLLG